ncbi:sugar transferase [Halomonas campisalis]|uniref:Sugar transferase n=1 Tax=Billgrantia campisalis TaxID=74661 RepID=A0ABS9P3G2_9GAMM|nr:sugar transferase [Halomonas campisalis]MCG6656330.1 sugar transferase [Halomonas campisalis]MDR5861516.1 sugar transferase [Halomonas campisalis]
MENLAKRLFDIVSSAAALIILGPLLLAIALWIKVDSRGPVFFMQQRAGLGGRPFRIVKFRTMIHRASDEIDQHSEQVLSTGCDLRITRTGQFIRATSLDELPQLINILKGDMSVVGPRPVLMEQKEVVPPGYMKRFSVRPGLTGLAQVRGRRSLGWLQQLAYDAEYVENHHFLYDLGIILQTIKVVLLGSGIYGGEGLNWRAYRDSLGGRPPLDEDVTAALACHEPEPEKVEEGHS